MNYGAILMAFLSETGRPQRYSDVQFSVVPGPNSSRQTDPDSGGWTNEAVRFGASAKRTKHRLLIFSALLGTQTRSVLVIPGKLLFFGKFLISSFELFS